ncbi:MAG TPA: hypothetical protein VE442_25870 [Jatrophihabitans sp.]|nr:hypothetical protein [Jatrophihabitans sp.]
MLASGLIWAAIPAQAASCPTPGNFEIDGDMLQLTCNPGPQDDWNTPNIGVQSTTQGGTYSTAGKDDSNPSTWVSSGSTPDKTNFERAYATSRVVNGHFYVYVAWERTSTSGTQGYAIEIDNSGANTAADGTPQPNRGSGGAVFYISSQGSSAPQFDSACTFTTQSTYGQTCTNSSMGVTAAINTGSISDPLAGTTQPAGSFFEIAIDVTSYTGIAPSCPGAAANSVYLRSITGQTHNGNLKGYMAPLSVAPNSTCVAPPIDTTATPGNSTIDGLQVTPIGSDQHDEVTVGTAQAPGVGSVKFFLCQPAQVTANGCESGGSPVPSNGNSVTLDANGTADSPTINGGTTPNDNGIGTYCWRAEFTPSANDRNYLAGSHTNNTTECFTVAHASPNIATQSSADTGSSAATNSIGYTTLGDTATLSNVYSGADLSNQNVTFKLYGPLSSAPGANDCTAGALVFGPVVASLTKVDNTTWQAIAPTFKPTASNGPGYYTWVASYGGDQINDSAAGACGAANETQHLVGPLLQLEKGTPHATITAGDDIVYDLNLANVGAGTASGVVVTDVLPTLAGGGTWTLAGTSGYNCSIADGTGGNAGHQVVTCSIGQLDPSASTQIAEVSAPTSTADCGDVNNSAVLEADPDVSQTAGPVKVHVQCPHLTITKQADAGSVDVGSNIGFKITVTNDGAGTATGVVISDPLPSGPGISWSIVSETGPLTCDDPIVNNTLHCTGSLPENVSEVVHVTSATVWNSNANSCSGSPYDNTASVSADNAVIDDPNASASEKVLCPDIDITKVAEPGDQNSVQVTDGTPVGWTITGTNNGAGTATDADINDQLPTGLNWTIDSQQINGTDVNVCSIDASNLLSCSGFDLAPGDSIVVTLSAPTPFSSCGTYNNTAQLTAGNTPQQPEDSASVKVVCANLEVVKEADHNQPVSVGSDIGFKVTISNTGDGDANGVAISDNLPTGPNIEWHLDSATGALSCGVSGSTLTCTGDLAAGATEVVHVFSHTAWTTVGGQDERSCDGGPDNDGVYPNTAQFQWRNGPNGTFDSNEATETVLCPDLTITKTADAASVSAGDPIGFSIEVTNTGAGTAKDVQIHDDLPTPNGTDVIWGSATIDPAQAGSCMLGGNPGAQTLDCDLGDVGPNADVTIHISAQTTEQSCAGYDNTAKLTTSNVPGDHASASTSVLCANVSIIKTADDDTVSAGDPIGFTITVSNSAAAGTGTARAVVLDDPLPAGAGVDWTIQSGPGNCSIQGDPPTETLHCNAVDLAAGESETVHVASGTTFDSCDVLKNEAGATGSNIDPITANADTTVQCPSLTLTKTADHGTVDAGDQIGFTVTVSNGGPGDAKDVVVDDLLPGGTGVDWSIQSGPGNCSIQGNPPNETLHCTAVTLGSGDSEVIDVVSGTEFASCTVYDNTATVTASNSPSPDPAKASVDVQCAELTLTKEADKDTVDAGDAIGFTIKASNSDAAGTGTAHGVVLDDPLPSGDGVDWSIDVGPANCSIVGNLPNETLHCTAFDLGPGVSLTVHVVSSTAYASCDVYPNEVNLTAANHPSLKASDSTTVQCPKLSVVKEADDATVSSGDTIGFTVTMHNDGPGTAKSVTLQDPLPAGGGVEWSIDQAVNGCQVTGPVGAQVLGCSFNELGSGVTVSVHVTSATTLDSCTTYPNTATLSATNHPDVTDDADTTVQCPNVSIVKTADAATVSAGSQIGFTVTASNSDAPGTGIARGVVIEDPLPGGSGVDWSIESGPQNCSITGTAPTQTLECTAVDLEPGVSESVHLVSDTAFASCATYDNTASLTLSNGTVPDPASASEDVQCPALAIGKTADADSVKAGNQIGFLITVTNSGPGTASGVTLTDPLPQGKGVSWSIDDAATSASGCSISDGTLSCDLGDLDAGASLTVHLVSASTLDSCAKYPNVATLDAANAPELTADANTRVTTCLGTEPTSTEAPPPSTSTPPSGPVAFTGVGRLDLQLLLVALLVGGGIVFVVAGRRRRGGRHAQ